MGACFVPVNGSCNHVFRAVTFLDERIDRGEISLDEAIAATLRRYGPQNAP